MNLKYYKKIKKLMSQRFSLSRKQKTLIEGYGYTILRDGIFFNPYGEGYYYRQVKFSYNEFVSEEEAIKALKDTIRCATFAYIHKEWKERDKLRKEKAFQERVNKAIEC